MYLEIENFLNELKEKWIWILGDMSEMLFVHFHNTILESIVSCDVAPMSFGDTNFKYYLVAFKECSVPQNDFVSSFWLNLIPLLEFQNIFGCIEGMMKVQHAMFKLDIMNIGYGKIGPWVEVGSRMLTHQDSYVLYPP